MKKLRFHLVCLLLFFGQSIGLLNACSIAIHDWKLALDVKVPIPAPLLPVSELSLIESNLDEQNVNRIIWLSDHNSLTIYLLSFLPFFENWAAHIPWTPMKQSSHSVAELARSSLKEKNPPLIVGSDRNYLRFALFFDSYSNNKCIQLVVMQTSRIRAVFPDSTAPWARETNAQSWFSLIFFQAPIPGSVMSVALYPIHGTRRAYVDNHDFVEELIRQGHLKRRPDLTIDPYEFDFPDLPE